MTIVPGSQFARVKIGGSFVDCEPKSFAKFDHGTTLANGQPVAGSALPAENRQPGQTIPVYTGGIGIQSGIVLSTGYVTDALSPSGTPAGRGVGVQGPNNGIRGPATLPLDHPGEASTDTGGGVDDDFAALFPPHPDEFKGADGTCLEFQVSTTHPGFFKIALVLGSDEHPGFSLDQYNDTVAVMVDGKNIFTFRKHVPGSPPQIEIKLFDLVSIRNCGPRFFLQNQIAPYPDALDGSAHTITDPVGYMDYYDHEFGGFSVPLKRESGDRGAGLPEPVKSGTHTIKIVIQDADEDDHYIDAAAFIQAGSFKFTKILPADFNMDGNVDGTDFGIWNSNKFTSGDKRFIDGDANFDGVVDGSDFNIWNANKFTGGGYVYRVADLNDDGQVTCADRGILVSYMGITDCAGRFEGDIDGDADVDATDLLLFDANISTSCP